MSNDLQRAIAAIKAGDKKSGQQLLAQVVNADPQNEAAWLWMGSTLDDPQEKKECLQKVLQINPDNEMAKKALAPFEGPREPAELPRFGDISPKPSQKTAPSTGLAGSRLWRLSLVVLGGVAVLLVLCIGAMLVVSSLVGREALVSVFGPSNPPAPATEPQQTFEAYPATWTPGASDTPSPTQTPMPTLGSVVNVQPADREIVRYLEALAPISNEILSNFPGDSDAHEHQYYIDLFVAKQEQLEDMTVPEEARRMHYALTLVAGNAARMKMEWQAAFDSYPSYELGDLHTDNAKAAGDDAVYHVEDYYAQRQELLRKMGLTRRELGFTQ